jgi:hypothetical protein
MKERKVRSNIGLWAVDGRSVAVDPFRSAHTLRLVEKCAVCNNQRGRPCVPTAISGVRQSSGDHIGEQGVSFAASAREGGY